MQLPFYAKVLAYARFPVLFLFMLAPLSSRQNQLCKQIRSLHHSKGRREHHLFLAEGKNAVEAALQSRWPITRVLCAPNEVACWGSQTPDTPVQPVEFAILEYLSQTQTNPGVLALCELPQANDDFNFEDCLLVLDGVSDPGNIGTCLRSVDATGAGGVLCAANSADPFSPKAVRSSAGSLFHAPPIVLRENSPEAIAATLKALNTPIIIADGSADVSCFDYAWPQHCALVLGHETRGVSSAFKDAATIRLKVPIVGHAESLNVAMAGTVLLYAWRNARGLNEANA